MERPTRVTVKLTGTDGNAFALLSKARRAAKNAGWTNEQWEEFQRQATSGDYNQMLATMMEWFQVE